MQVVDAFQIDHHCSFLAKPTYLKDILQCVRYYQFMLCLHDQVHFLQKAYFLNNGQFFADIPPKQPCDMC